MKRLVASLVITGAVLGWIGVLATQGQQRNPPCVVAVLNRTAFVQPDGSWVINNIPSNMGLVRARMTCVRDGQTISGQSDYFQVIPGVITQLDAPIELGVVDPVPERIEIVAPTTTLTNANLTVQLTVIATYPDGTTRDITLREEGTNYTTSNPGIANVSGNGLVTAIASGTVLISASNEQVFTSKRITVLLSGDTDGDGMPDDYELANGLDPNDPVDAAEDPDGDTLSNLQEFQQGTDPFNPDTDGDTLTDGQEVNGTTGFFTDPLLFDTDGDQIGDGLEISVGTDPTDPASFNFGAVLTGIDVKPDSVTLIVNTIVSEATAQLIVTGFLVDGTTADLTRKSTGTTYLSSDLLVVNFGVTDGKIFAGQDGTATIRVRNSGFQDVVPVTVSTFTPLPLSRLDLPSAGFANNIHVVDDIAYIAHGAAGLVVVSLGNRTNPSIAGSVDTPGNANDVKVQGNFAYVADGSAGLQIVDISTPSSPVLRGGRAIDDPGTGEFAWDVAAPGDDRAYVAYGAAGLVIYDVSDPDNPVILGRVDTPGTAKGVDVNGTHAVVADGSSGVHVIDISDPAAPQIVGSVSVGGDARDLVAVNRIAYVATFVTDGFRTVDFTVPTNPVHTASEPLGNDILQDVAVFGRFAVGADVVRPNGVPIYDIGPATNPILRDVMNFIGLGDANGLGIDIDDNFIYLVAGPITENGTTGGTQLYIGQYLSLQDPYGIAPTVTITSPVDGGNVFQRGFANITVDAVDDVFVQSVTFFIDGQPVFTDFGDPFVFPFLVPDGVTQLTIGATAADLAGNTGVAEEVTVNVLEPSERIASVAAFGTPANPGLPSANAGQTIVLESDAPGKFTSSTQVTFPTISDTGAKGTATRTVNSVAPDGSRATVVVPDDAETGGVTASGLEANFALQIVPRLTSFSNANYAPGVNLDLNGTGFIEGGSTVNFGFITVIDPDTGTGTINVFNTNKTLRVTIPGGVTTPDVRVTTVGGTSNALTVGPGAFTDLIATAQFGTPANPVQRSANVGQVITIVGASLKSNANVVFPIVDDSGGTGTTSVQIQNISVDGTSATVTVPNNAVTGNVTMLGTSGVIRLQIVPRITSSSVSGSDGFTYSAKSRIVQLNGSGFVEGQTTVNFGDFAVVDPSTTADIIDVFSSGTSLNVPVPLHPGGTLTVVTAGGISNPFNVGPIAFTGIEATASFGTPADSALPSANVGQTITITGEGLNSNSAVLFPAVNDDGIPHIVSQKVTSANADGTQAILTVPQNAVSGIVVVPGAETPLPAPEDLDQLTLVYENDFESSAGPQWSSQTRTTTTGTDIQTTAYLGRFSNDNLLFTLTGLPEHTRVVIVTDLFIVDSWDGGISGFAGPDRFGFHVAGRGSWEFDRSFPADGSATSIDRAPDVRGEFGPIATWQDSLYRDVAHAFRHTGDTLQVRFYGTGLQGISDESWGLDNFRVYVDNTPLPPAQERYLQVVPRITSFENDNYRPEVNLRLRGHGFVEGASTVNFGPVSVNDPNIGTGTINVWNTSTILDVTIPRFGSGEVTVSTSGGTSNPFIVGPMSFTGIQASASFGTPADDALPSANVGQTITITGTDLKSNTNVFFPTVDQEFGIPSGTWVQVSGVNADGTAATVVVPNGATTGPLILGGLEPLPPDVPSTSGMTQVYSTDFEAGSGAEWSTSSVTTNAATTAYLGRFANNTATLTLTDIPAHSSVVLVWDLLIIDSWDGGFDTGCCNPDLWGFNVDGLPSPQFQYAFPADGGLTSFYRDPDVVRDDFGVLGGWPDRIYRNVSRAFNHGDGTLQVSFFGAGLEGVNNESWGIDNVRVFVTDSTVPPQPEPLPATTLQVVPRITGFDNSNFRPGQNLRLFGSGFAEGANTVLFGSLPVTDPDGGAGTIDVWNSSTILDVTIPRFGRAEVSVVGPGGTSNPLVVGPTSFTGVQASASFGTPADGSLPSANVGQAIVITGTDLKSNTNVFFPAEDDDDGLPSGTWVQVSSVSLDGTWATVVVPSRSVSGPVVLGGLEPPLPDVPDTAGLAPVYSADFEGAVGGEWSSSTTSTHAATTTYLGRFANNTVDLTLTGLPAHSSVVLVWDLLIIDSWDGSGAGCCSPDTWGFNVAGRPAPEFQYAFPADGGLTSFYRNPDVVRDDFGVLGGWPDRIYRNVSHAFNHSDGTLQVSFYGVGLEGVNNESWGIDNVRVFVTDSTVPPQPEPLPATTLQVVPRLTSFSNSDFAPSGTSRNLQMFGSGFVEGRMTVHFGGVDIADPNTGSDIIDVFSGSTSFNTVIPSNPGGEVSVTTNGGTSNVIAVGPTTLTAIEAVATHGMSADPALPSANVGQRITIRGTAFGPNTNVAFPSRDDSGNPFTGLQRVSTVNVDGTEATVVVPNNAITGQVQAVGAVGSVTLQVVPRITGHNNGDFRPGVLFAIFGSGFVEGDTTVHFGSQPLVDPDTGTGTIDVHSSATWLSINSGIPANAGGLVSVETDGGVSNAVSIGPTSFTGVQSVASYGTPADPGLPSANAGQLITVSGSDFGPTARLLFPTMDDGGNPGTAIVGLSNINASGTQATATVPTNAVTGSVSMPGTGSSFVLQVVPRINTFSFTSFSAGATFQIQGGGFIEGATTVHFGASSQTDPNTGSGTLDVFNTNTTLNVTIPASPGTAITVQTAGGTSNPLDVELPTLALTSPSDSESVPGESIVMVTASTHDMGGIQSVEWSLDGAPVSAFDGTVFTTSVDGRANIFGAGHSSPPGGGVLPPGVSFLAQAGQVMRVLHASGNVSGWASGCAYNGPDGGQVCASSTNVASSSGISGLIHSSRTMFLAGVFLSDTEPVNPAPNRLNVTSFNDEAVISPLLNQTFFIGDGRTSSGQLQQFVVPTGATRLFLGFVETSGFSGGGTPGAYSDNGGSLTVGLIVGGTFSEPVRIPGPPVTSGQTGSARLFIGTPAFAEGGDNTLAVSGTVTDTDSNASGSNVLTLNVVERTFGTSSVADRGTPANPALASANVGQKIVLEASYRAFNSRTLVVFPTVNDSGVAGLAWVVVSSATENGTSATVVVPNNAVTGAVEVQGVGSLQLQVVPHISTFDGNSSFWPGQFLRLHGGGFIEGATTINFGSVQLVDSSTSTSPVDVHSSGTQMNLNGGIPSNAGSFVSVTTDGGTSNVFAVGPAAFTGIVATASLGTPADGGLPSANPEQTITITGTGLRTNTNVIFPARNSEGIDYSAAVLLSNVNADGTAGTVQVPLEAITGDVRLFGLSNALRLQIVPRLFGPDSTTLGSDFRDNIGSFRLNGRGFVEGATTVNFGSASVIDPNTGTSLVDVFSSNTAMNVTIPSSPGGLVTVTTEGGTSNEVAYGPTEFTGVEGTASFGTPADPGLPSANPSQTIKVTGSGFRSNTVVIFPAVNNAGVPYSDVRRLTNINADGTEAQVQVPPEAVTGQVSMPGTTSSFTLQVVPRLFEPNATTLGTNFDDNVANLRVRGQGFVEGQTIVNFGSVAVVDPDTGSGTIDVFSSNGEMNVNIPAGPGGLLSVATAGGTSNEVAYGPTAFTGIVAEASFGTPADASSPSANAGQLITVTGANFRSNTVLVFPASNASGIPGTASQRVSNVNADGTEATVVVPLNAVTGDVYMPGTNTSLSLQIVPRLFDSFDGNDFREGQTITLHGRGFIEGQVTVSFGEVQLVDPDTGSGTIDVWSNNHDRMNVTIPANPGGEIRVTTPGGTSNMVALGPTSFTGIVAASTFGMPADGGLPSANASQLITVQGTGFRHNTNLVFPTNNAAGASGEAAARVQHVSADGTEATVFVPINAMTGNVSMPGTPDSLFLQIVPRLFDSFDGNDFREGQTITLHGRGFIEGQVRVSFGDVQVVDPDTGSGTIDVWSNNNDRMNVTIPAEPGGEIRVTTPGGSSNVVAFGPTSFTGIVATASFGTPADPGKQSANAGQRITITGSGFRSITNLAFPSVTHDGIGYLAFQRVDGVNADGTQATIVVPSEAVTGQAGIVGTSGLFDLQVVPRISSFSFSSLSAGSNLRLNGAGFVEGQVTVNFGEVSVVDPDTTGTTINVFSSNTAMDVTIPANALPQVTVVTPGGTSNQVALLSDGFGIAPSVAITSPALAETVFEGGVIDIVVSASDDVFLASVTTTVKDPLFEPLATFTSRTPPYRFRYFVPAGSPSQLVIEATATDLGGNVGVAENVIVNVAVPSTSIASVAEVGSPTLPTVPSANVGQTITLNGDPGTFTAATAVTFPTRNDSGTGSTQNVTVSSVSADGSSAEVVVPQLAVTGGLTISGVEGNFALLVVPRLTSFTNADFRPSGSSRTLALTGSGFEEGGITVNYGARQVIDPDTGIGTVNVFSNNTSLDAVIPGNPGSEVTVTTAGGTSNGLVVGPESFTGIEATSDFGTPANPSLPSANVGQTINVSGTGLKANTNVTFTTTNDSGIVGATSVRVSTVSADGTRATVVVPGAATTGPVSMPGVDSSFTLQVVPRLTSFSNASFAPSGTSRSMQLFGSAFVEGGVTVHYGATQVVDPNIGSGTVDVLPGNSRLDVVIPSNPGSTVRVTTAGGTSNELTVGPTSFTGVIAVADFGAPASAGVASANPGQRITVTGANLKASTNLVFPTVSDEGVSGFTFVQVSGATVDGTSASVVVPLNAATGTVTMVGTPGAFTLQIVPRLTGFTNTSFAPSGTSRSVQLFGMGFIEGGITVHYGSTSVADPNISSTILDVFSTNTSLNVIIPDGAQSDVRVTTVGGTSNVISVGPVSFTGLESVATHGTPANPGLPSANAGQAVKVLGTGLTTSTNLVFPTVDDGGIPGRAFVQVSGVNADGTEATVDVPLNAVTGAVTMFGTGSSFTLQVVPRLFTSYTNSDFAPSGTSRSLQLFGRGFVEGGTTVNFGATQVVDPDISANIIDVFSTSTSLNVVIPPGANSQVSLTTAGGTSNSVTVGPVAFTGIEATATFGTPKTASMPSANPGQTITVNGVGLTPNTNVAFRTMSDEGIPGTSTVRVNGVSADGTRATVGVPTNAVTGTVTLPGATGSAELQVVPRLLSFSNNSDFVPGAFIRLEGRGFVEGAVTVDFGGVQVIDPNTGTSVINVHSTNTGLDMSIPGGAGSSVTVTTAGGTSNVLLVGPQAFTGLQATATFGTPADSGVPSANPGQTIAITGTGLTANTNLVFPFVDDSGIPGVAYSRISNINVDGTRATVVVPNGAVTGSVTMFGAPGSFQLQIVPRITSFSYSTFTAGNNLRLDGRGFTEGATTVRFGSVQVVDPNTGAGTLDVFFSGTAMNVTIPSGAGQLVSVTTNGGTSNAVHMVLPTIAITSPADGDAVAENSTIAISTLALDNAGIKSVEFFVNGESQGVDTSSPFSLAFTVPAFVEGGDNTLAFTAVATDTNDNTATTQDVTVSVVVPTFTVQALADDGTPADAGLPSANAGQTITIVRNFRAFSGSSQIVFPTINDSGTQGTSSVQVSGVELGGMVATVVVPSNAMTGVIHVAGETPTDGVNAATLQVVPRLTSFSNNDDFVTGAFLRLRGSGLIEGGSTVSFGGVQVVDPNTGTETINVHSTNSALDLSIPAGATGAVTVTTAGGTSNTLNVGPLSFTGVTATAEFGTPASSESPSANVGQTITITGSGFRSNTNVVFPTVNDSGGAGTASVRVSWVNIGGAEATVVVPNNAVTGAVSVPGTDSMFMLQVVPRLTGFSNADDFAPNVTIRLHGNGFVEGAISVTFGKVVVVDPGNDGTLINVHSSATLLDVTIPGSPGSEVTVVTSGGISNSLTIGPTSFTGLSGTASVGTPADPSAPSANAGQAITITGTGLRRNTNVVFQTVNDSGVPSRQHTRVSWVSADGTEAAVNVPPAAVTGIVNLAGLLGAQNLLQNPSADELLVGGEIPGWTEVVGADWKQRSSNPSPFEGPAYFYPGVAPLAELAQDVDVSSFASEIDAGAQSFIFAGFVRSFNQTPPDTSRIVVEYRAADGSVLESFDSGETASRSAWQRVSDTRVVPVGTRTIRVRLISTRNNGTNNDGYFDALSLHALSTDEPEKVIQVVPRLTSFSSSAVSDFAPGVFIRLNGGGFVEGSISVAFGDVVVEDPDEGTGVINVHSTSSGLDMNIPNGGGSAVTVTTDGGASNRLIVGPETFTGIAAVASVGTPTDPGLPSANVGQTITIIGTGLRDNTNVRFPTVNDSGTPGSVLVRVSGINADRTEATVVVPNGAVTGDVTVPGTSGAVRLQVVPRISSFSLSTGFFAPGATLGLNGGGYVEGAMTVHFGSVAVVDPDTGTGTLNVFSNGTSLNVTIPSGAEGIVTVETAGGVSNAVAVGIFIPSGQQNLSLLPGTTALSSSDYSSSYDAPKGIDGNLSSGWYTTPADPNRTYSVILPEDVTVHSIAIYPDFRFLSGYNFTSGRFRIFDASDTQLFDSGVVSFTNGYIQLDIDPAIGGAREVSFDGISWDRMDQNIESGFGEFVIAGTVP